MTITRHIIIVLLAGLLCSCSAKHKAMPEGFRLMCNANGEYVVGRTSLDSPYILCYNGKVCSDKQEAIERAWGQYKYENTPRPTWDMRTPEEAGFHECESPP
jgi:hypothetical protein